MLNWVLLTIGIVFVISVGIALGMLWFTIVMNTTGVQNWIYGRTMKLFERTVFTETEE